jgi:methionyl-tRNA formyltransferase
VCSSDLKGAELLARALALIAGGKDSRVPQDDGAASYCGLLTREHGKIDWKNSAVRIERMIRAFDPWPGAWTSFRGAALRIMAADALGQPSGEKTLPAPGKVLGVDTRRGILVQTGDGLLAVRSLQLQAKKALGFASFMNGVRGFTGSVLGDIR